MHRAGAFAHARGEQRLGRDHQRQARHRRVDCEYLAVVPTRACGLGQLDHAPAVIRDALLVKSGLQHSPVRQVHRLLGGQQTLPEKRAQALHAAALDEVARFRNQQVVDERGLAEQHETPAQKRPRGNRSELACNLTEKRQKGRQVARSAHAAKGGDRSRPGRETRTHL